MVWIGNFCGIKLVKWWKFFAEQELIHNIHKVFHKACA